MRCISTVSVKSCLKSSGIAGFMNVLGESFKILAEV